MAEDLMPIGSFTSTLAVGDANVSDEISRAGASFGDLVLKTGEAVAETMKKLNETGANTATELANTVVDVIALQEKIYDDLGNVTQVKSYVEKLPLVNFIDPVFYQWSEVRLQGVFIAREFASASSFSSSSSTMSDKSGQGGLLVFFGGGRTTFDGATASTDVESASDSDISFGNVRMNALLEPRRDVGVPKPTQVIQGPRLALIQGSKADILDGDAIKGRTLDVLIQYHRRDGTAIQGKSISVEAPDVTWSFTGGQTTDAQGNLQIRLQRDFVGEDPDTSQKDFVVTARIGIVQSSLAVTF